MTQVDSLAEQWLDIILKSETKGQGKEAVKSLITKVANRSRMECERVFQECCKKHSNCPGIEIRCAKWEEKEI
jgi:hypothetical protein